MDKYADIRAALEQKCHAILIEDVDVIRALLAERDALREALAECLRVNETDAGNDVRVWANAMLVARTALAQEES